MRVRNLLITGIGAVALGAAALSLVPGEIVSPTAAPPAAAGEEDRPDHPGEGAASDTVFLVETPSGINRFVRAAHRIRAEEEAAGGRGTTHWIFRTTRQVQQAGPDSLRMWLEAADRGVVRLATGDVAERIDTALRAREDVPATLWIYHSPIELQLHSQLDGERFLEGMDESRLRDITELGGDFGHEAAPAVRAWHQGLAYLNARGPDGAERLLRFLDDAHGSGAERALNRAPGVPEPSGFERYPLEAGGGERPSGEQPAVGIVDFDSYALNSEAQVIDSLAAGLRRRNLEPIPIIARWGEETVDAMQRHFLAPDGTPEVEAILSLQSFVLGGDAARARADSLLDALDVPVFRTIRLTDLGPGEWRRSAEGIPWGGVYHQVAMPELQGMIEPLVVAAETTGATDPLTGAERGLYAPIRTQVELVSRRVERWIQLRHRPPDEKRIALVYYNHPPGQQNIGADNLNVTRSLVRLLELLENGGYDLGAEAGATWTQDPDTLVARLVREGVNTAVYGEGQLRDLVERGATLVPEGQYLEWYERLPLVVRREVEDGPLGYVEALLERNSGGVPGAGVPGGSGDGPLAAPGLRGEGPGGGLSEEIDLLFAQMREFFDAFPPRGPERGRGPARLDAVERAARNVMEGTGDLDAFRAAKEEFLALGIEALSGWGPPPGEVMTIRRNGEDHLVVPGIRAGNIFLGPQPQRGYHADPEKVHASTLVSPPHQYLAFYGYLAHEFGADALVHLGRHSSYEWLPRKSVGVASFDHPVAVLFDLPSIYPYTVDGVGEGLQAKRRGLAAVVDHLTPPLQATELYGELLELQSLHDSYHAQEEPDRRAAIAETIRDRLEKDVFADLREEIRREGGGGPLEEMDDPLLVHEVGHELGHQREQMIPYGLHSFATPWTAEEEEMLARSMVSLQVDTSETGGSARADSARTRIRELLRQSVRDEGEAILDALAGRRVEPGPGNDPIRTPEVLPTGRNFHALAPSLVPTAAAFAMGREQALRSLEVLRDGPEEGPSSTPERVSAVLWAVETTRDEGAMVGFVLEMLGIAPKWDARGQVQGVRRIPLDSLGRPRVDVTLVTSGLFRDLFAPVLRLLDESVRRALAGAGRTIARSRPELVPALKAAVEDLPRDEWGEEPLERNHVARHWIEEVEEDLAADPGRDPAVAGRSASARIFGPAPGDYGSGINYLVNQPWTWTDRSEVADHYLRRMQYSYGRGGWGRPGGTGQDGLARKLRGVEASFHSRASNLYGIADNDDFFDYFGGLSLAAERVNGEEPENLVLDSSNPRSLQVTPLRTYLAREVRARYYNPEWIEGQMEEGYDGARTISSKFVEFLWGWQVTNPDIVREWMWEEIQDVYLEDRHDLGLDTWAEEGDRAFAMQNVAAILLTAAERGFWQADEERLQRIADRLATLAHRHGLACSSHICGNKDAMAFAASHLDDRARARFRRQLDRARRAEPVDAAAEAAREEEASTEGREPTGTPDPTTESVGDLEGPPEEPPDEPSPSEETAEREDARRSAVYEVTLRARELAGSTWGWVGGIALLALVIAFGSGVLRRPAPSAPQD